MTQSIIEEAAAGRAKLKGLTVEQYDALIDSGLLPPDPRTELINGFIVQKDRSHVGEDPTIGDRHRVAVELLSVFKPKFVAFGCYMQNQQPVTIPPDHEPEPDGSVIAGRLGATLEKPGPADVLSVIEVADASLHYDLNVKLGLYSGAGIPQYVVVDLVNNIVIVHEEAKSGSYERVTMHRRGESVRINAGAGMFVEMPTRELMPGV